MSKTVTLRLPDDVYEAFREAAEAQRRPLSNLIEIAALAKIREEQFADDFEMAELRTDDKLLKRLKAGSDKLHQHVYPQLRQRPHFGPNIKKFKDYFPPTWRYRISVWRFFYEIDEKQHIVFLVAAAHRSAAY